MDDKLWGHPKWLAVPPRARGLWVTAGSWSAANETDGRIPRHVIRSLGGTTADATALVEAGLWREVKAGWIFHEWSIYQPDAASRKAKRQAGLDSGAWGNHKRWHEARDIKVPDCEYCQGMPPGFPTAPAIDEPEDPRNVSGDPMLTRIGISSPPNRPVPEPDTRSDTHLGDNYIAQPPVERTPAPARFDEFWAAYPRKVGKAKARTKYATACKRAAEQRIIDGAYQLRDDPNLPEQQFIPHPTTWLERDGWEDEPLPPRLGTTRQREQANFWQAEIAAGRAYDEARAQDQHKEITA